MDALEPYLVELSANRLAGAVPETSGYGALAALLNEVGQRLKPKVRCVINPANRGAGIPDGGLFVASQFQKGVAEPLPGQLPARGAVEVKPVGGDVHLVAESEQVRRYLETYRQVLVSTYREFVLVGYDADGAATLLESYSLSEYERAWRDSPIGEEFIGGEAIEGFVRGIGFNPDAGRWVVPMINDAMYGLLNVAESHTASARNLPDLLTPYLPELVETLGRDLVPLGMRMSKPPSKPPDARVARALQWLLPKVLPLIARRAARTENRYSEVTTPLMIEYFAKPFARAKARGLEEDGR